MMTRPWILWILTQNTYNTDEGVVRGPPLGTADEGKLPAFSKFNSCAVRRHGQGFVQTDGVSRILAQQGGHLSIKELSTKAPHLSNVYIF